MICMRAIYKKNFLTFLMNPFNIVRYDQRVYEGLEDVGKKQR